MCRVLGVSESGYYRYIGNKDKPGKDKIALSYPYIPYGNRRSQIDSIQIRVYLLQQNKDIYEEPLWVAACGIPPTIQETGGMIDRRDFEASFRYAPFGFKILPTAHSFWVFPDCTFLDNSTARSSISPTSPIPVAAGILLSVSL